MPLFGQGRLIRGVECVVGQRRVTMIGAAPQSWSQRDADRPTSVQRRAVRRTIEGYLKTANCTSAHSRSDASHPPWNTLIWSGISLGTSSPWSWSTTWIPALRASRSPGLSGKTGWSGVISPSRSVAPKGSGPPTPHARGPRPRVDPKRRMAFFLAPRRVGLRGWARRTCDGRGPNVVVATIPGR